MTQELSFDINELVAVLNKSPHRDLSEYIPIADKAMKSDPLFFHHFLAWNHIKGQIRDAKVALPVLGLTAKSTRPQVLQVQTFFVFVRKPDSLVSI